MILWTKVFMEEQGYEIERNMLHHGNKSAILLEENGKKSSDKMTRALNIRCFFLTDQVEKGNVIVKCCPTDNMVGDFHAKPLQGEKFRKLCDTRCDLKTWLSTNTCIQNAAATTNITMNVFMPFHQIVTGHTPEQEGQEV
jgi:hypothetical protein